MKHRMGALISASVVVMAAVLASQGAAWSAGKRPEMKETRTVAEYYCRATTAVGSKEKILHVPFRIQAPAEVRAGQEFTIIVESEGDKPKKSMLPGVKLSHLVNFTRTIKISDNAVITTLRHTGGTPEGTVQVKGQRITTHMPGPIAAGTFFQPPIAHITLVASSGHEVEIKLAGWEYDDPGMTMESVIKVFGVKKLHAPTACYPIAGRVLATIKVTD